MMSRSKEKKRKTATDISELFRGVGMNAFLSRVDRDWSLGG